MVDQVANFKKVTVSTGYNNTATSIVLATGQGAELPDPSGDNYNVVWYDSTNYPDPADDPNVEIVRVTAKSTDTLTVTRNQESSGASNKNNADATYKMILATTAKTTTDITDTVQIDSINNEVGIGTAPVSGSSLALPLHNDEVTPTLAFGDGDTGFYESSDDILICSVGGVKQFYWDYNKFRGINTDGPALINIAATATVPTINPEVTDSNTGLGASGADQMSLIAGGVEGHRISESSGNISHVLIGIVKTPTTETRTGAGPLDLVTAMTLIVTNGVNAITLGDGAEGQEKFIVMKTYAGDGTLTPAHLKNGTTITFNAVGDSAHLIFMDGDWVFMGGTATLA